MPKRNQKYHEPLEAELSNAEPDVAADEVVIEAEPVGASQATLAEELLASRAEAASNWDQLLRSRAELENFRKRVQRDREELVRFANDNLLREMVPVLDNLERALEHAAASEGEQPALIEGVAMTVTLFRKVLENAGVKAIESLGAPFDPNLHQAMGQVESSEQPPNTVVSVYQKGYLLNERLLRPALVLLAKAPVAD